MEEAKSNICVVNLGLRRALRSMALVALCGGVHPRRLAWQVQEPMRRLRQLVASAPAEKTRAGSGWRWPAATRGKLPSHAGEPSPSAGGLSGIPWGGSCPAVRGAPLPPGAGRKRVRHCPAEQPLRRCTRLLRRPAGERHRPDHAGWLCRPQECSAGSWGSYSDARKGGGERWKEVIPYAHLSWDGLAKPGSVETADSCVSAEPG